MGLLDADSKEMASPNCDACGSGLPDFDARSCAACGATVEQPANSPAVDDPLRRTMTDEQWQYVTWGAVAVGAVAVVALIAVVFGLLSHEDAAEATSDTAVPASSTTTAISASDELGRPSGLPVSSPVLIEYPRLWSANRYNRNGAVVALRVTMNACERREGMLHASGTIRNDSPADQALSYRIGVDLTRAVVGTPLGSVETTVNNLGPGEATEWMTETVSTKAVSLRCELAMLTVAPATPE